MSGNASASGGQSQRPSGGRSTGAAGGENGKFPCRNYQQSGHPSNVWVDVNGARCAHCLCAPRQPARYR
ncbi:hypothetical protein GQ44DRAFT_712755 [Phaeosphaeriaceae sp. PMI808]|nr:hypothetical protein GQ44DRAFT_712755 [Phaeosphaeriaceae sp. PMI808]